MTFASGVKLLFLFFSKPAEKRHHKGTTKLSNRIDTHKGGTRQQRRKPTNQIADPTSCFLFLTFFPCLFQPK